MKTNLTPRTTLLLALSLALACLLGIEPAPIHAAIFTVNTFADEQDNTCSDSDCSLRDAINAAATGDTIVFAPALSGRTITLTLGQLNVGNGLTIDGSGLVEHVKISGNSTFRVFATYSSNTVILRDLDIVHGHVNDGNGGSGIYNQRDLTVIGCAISDNTTPNNGGGIRNAGTLAIDDSIVSGNAAGYGGGIRNEGVLTVTDSTVSGNTADFGGGIDNYVGSMELRNTLLERNTAVHYGGGIVTGATATIEDSMVNENSAESGGGIDSHEDGVTLTLTRCTFTGNTAHIPAGYGGALNNNQATVEVNDSAFEDNSADISGGGVYNGSDGTLTINDSAFTGNTASSLAAGFGGAIGNKGALALNRNTLSGNTALVNGGGIENWGGELTATDCTFTSNRAANGGAINNNDGSTLTVRGSTFEDNIADGTGGGFFNDNSSYMTVENSTLSANTASYEGGGIYNVSGTITLSNATFDSNSAGSGGGINNQATLNYRNTLIAGSGGGDCVNSGTIGDNINNLAEDEVDNCGAAFDEDLRLGPLQDNGGYTHTHALLPDSPAIDAGDNTTCLATDQRGATRPVDGDGGGAADCDIGAFELGVIQCGMQAAGEPADYLFPGSVNLKVTDDGVDLDCLRVTAFPSDHPSATVLLQTGRYWQIRALTGDQLKAAEGGYMVDLTLPYGAADQYDTACRYSDAGWDCAASEYDENASVTRAAVDELSDWTVSSDACEAAAMPEPGISLAGIHKRAVLLSWDDDPANAGGYQVHRSTSPYFALGTDTLLTTGPPGSISFTDAGAAGTAGVSTTYIVRGLSNCGAPSPYDRRLGVFSFGLAPGQ